MKNIKDTKSKSNREVVSELPKNEVIENEENIGQCLQKSPCTEYEEGGSITYDEKAIVDGCATFIENDIEEIAKKNNESFCENDDNAAEIDKKKPKSKINRSSVYSIALVALFTALISVGAFIRIPLPVIPMTMQVFFVFLGAQFLGIKRSTAAAFLYMALGLIGIPIFTKGGGWSYIFQPSFGFIIGFIFASFAISLIIKLSFRKKRSFKYWQKYIIYFCAGLVGIVIIYAFGMVYFYMLKDLYFHTPVAFVSLFAILFLPTIVTDLLSLALATVVSLRLHKAVKLYK